MSDDLDKAFSNLTVHQRNVAWEEIALLKKQVEALQKENDDYDALLERLKERLTATANALHGGPREMSLHSWHDLAEIAERHRDFIEGVAEGDCAYNDNCPPNAGTRHYECDVCRARRALNPDKEVHDGPAETGTDG